MTSTIAQTDLEIEKIKKDLFKMAMRGQWEDVVNIYSENKKLHKAKLTSSGDTALHMAVSDGKEEEVRKLVGCIPAQPDRKDVLTIKNEQGSTPLHIAASMGNVAMCACIAEVDPSLVGARNDDNETPFFLAALSGKKDAFLRLHQICGTENGYEYSRRKDGDTILHCAIAGDYFDLAFRIIHLYDKLVNSFNEQGWTPLHLLASKPSAFRSGSHLGRWYKMIYHCIFVDELKKEPSDDHPTGPNNNLNHQKKKKYPENYRTCINFWKLMYWNVDLLINFLQWFWNVVTGALKKTQRTDAHTFDERSQGTADNNSGVPTDVENPKGGNQGSNTTNGAQGHILFPANYGTCFEFVKFASKAMLVILGLGSTVIRKIEEKKQKHTWAVQIMNELLRSTSTYEYDDTAGTSPMAGTVAPTDSDPTKPYAVSDGGTVNFAGEGSMLDPEALTTDTVGVGTKPEEKNRVTGGTNNTIEAANKEPPAKKESPILIAAKNGITEIVENILEHFPVAIHDMNEHKKNIVLLAVENRQPHVYQLLLRRNVRTDSVFRRVDNKGNSALHLAAKLGDNKPWLIPGAALQIQWEIKWHEFVKESMPFHFFPRQNKDGKTSREIFTETHKKLVEDGSQWLTSTSNSCSVVAALIATVAFASSTTVPGGVKQESGTPTLENQPAFDVFAISSLVALCFSVTALVMFLSILTSRYQEKDFGGDLPRKLLLGLTSLFVSIASMLIAFCAGHFFVLKDKLKYAAFPVYAVTCLPITFFAVAQFPLYFDLIWATFTKVPQRSYKVVL
ncbi:uncharacterized protein LOC126709518 isoform X4 [Quercus robur]|uniref:uncharacterized protein LOC126709518 isoform X4 n=1 Tax=Quercus robur TaxID=38942 RepID=UPI002162BDC4|nr:uncharacterized protein LOC126709518 isoform X4 [Quercus robur]